MTRHFAKLAIVALVGGVLSSNAAVAQILPPAKKAEHVKIIEGPSLELALDDLAIVRWTSTNPGGDDEHFAVAHYGTAPGDLSQTAKSHIRLNRNPSRNDFPCAHSRSEATDDLLLLGDFNWGRWKE
jgi:hypothetical protein